jgi:hypothetical protein
MSLSNYFKLILNMFFLVVKKVWYVRDLSSTLTWMTHVVLYINKSLDDWVSPWMSKQPVYHTVIKIVFLYIGSCAGQLMPKENWNEKTPTSILSGQEISEN